MPSLVDALDILKELGFYRVIFPLILIAVVTYGLLSKIELFGDNKSVNITIAAMVAFIVVSATEAIEFMIMFMQFMAVAGTIMLFLLLIFLFGGVKIETIGEVLQQPLAYGAVITITVIMIFIVASATVPQIGQVTEGELEGTSVTDKALKTLFHPTILGLIVLFSIFVVTVYMITRTPE